jgi:hypothetical protein
MRVVFGVLMKMSFAEAGVLSGKTAEHTTSRERRCFMKC